VTEHAPSLNYAQQPEGCKLHVEFFPGGVTFVDRPELLEARRPKSATVLIVKDGRISVDQPNRWCSIPGSSASFRAVIYACM
jgi:hypothetical protein